MENDVAKYRKYLGYTQSDMAMMFGVSLQAYSRKERGINAFNDKEKMLVKELFKPHFPEITMEKLFFNSKVPNVENEEVD